MEAVRTCLFACGLAVGCRRSVDSRGKADQDIAGEFSPVSASIANLLALGLRCGCLKVSRSVGMDGGGRVKRVEG